MSPEVGVAVAGEVIVDFVWSTLAHAREETCGQLDGRRGEQLKGALPRVAVPTLLVVGRRDTEVLGEQMTRPAPSTQRGAPLARTGAAENVSGHHAPPGALARRRERALPLDARAAARFAGRFGRGGHHVGVAQNL